MSGTVLAERGKKLHSLSVAHFTWNTRSKRVIEKCGFRYIETKRGSYTDYRGETLDEVCYLMTREESPAGKRQ